MTVQDDGVLGAEKRRCAAMLRGDVSALDDLLDERLIFAHATGAADDKAQYLGKVASGRIEYVDISWPESAVQDLGPQVTILSGRMITEVRVEGTAKQLRNRVISVWSADSGTWKLVAFQSTPDQTTASD